MFALLAMSVVVALFFIPAWGGPHGRMLSRAQDFAHVPLFALLTGGLLLIRGWGRRPVVRAAEAAGAAMVLAVVVELTQPLAGRTASMADLLLGVAGSLAVAAVYLAGQSASFHFRHGLRTCAIVLICVSAMPLAIVLADRYAFSRDFPLLDSFEGAAELERWEAGGCLIESTPRHATHGRRAMRLQVDDSGATYPSVFRSDAVMDWRGFQRLAMDIYLEGRSSRTVWLRADDCDNPRYADRAQMPIELKPGRNTVWVDLAVFARTPGGRMLDLGHVVTVGIFLEGARPGDTLYLDRMILSGAKSS